QKEVLKPLPGCNIAMPSVAYSIGGVVSEYLAGAFPVPSLDRIPKQDLIDAGRNGFLVVVPTNRPDTVARLAARFADAGVAVTEIQRYTIGAAPIKLSLYLIHLKMH
ncbi:MAG: hypothetical protein ACREFP_19575, partial [Acetobacteraceae bacterium]